MLETWHQRQIFSEVRYDTTNHVSTPVTKVENGGVHASYRNTQDDRPARTNLLAESFESEESAKQTPSDASMQNISTRSCQHFDGISPQPPLSVACAPLVLDSSSSENGPKGCTILPIVRYTRPFTLLSTGALDALRVQRTRGPTPLHGRKLKK